MKNKKILITGGAGFIGSHIIGRLIGDNEIVVIDTFTQDAIKHTDLSDHKNLRLVKGDVLDSKLLSKCSEGVDVVIHMAAIAGVENVLGNPTRTICVNLIGTHKVLEAFKNQKLERFVNFSTSEVYGPEADNVSEESLTSQGPVGEARWTYSISKIAAEHLGYRYMQEFNLPFVSIRPFNIYGPRQVGGGAIKIFTERAVRNQDIIVFSDGMGIRCYCYIDDFIDGVMKTIIEKKAIGEVFNLGNPTEPIASLTLAKKIIQKSNSEAKIAFKRDVKEDVLVRIPKIDKAKRLLGYEPKVMLDEGIENTINWAKGIWVK
ncbi:MAG: NAD-dependent epimerase/dehydratase family protein [Candidatus Micrarchaeota archaeon]